MCLSTVYRNKPEEDNIFCKFVAKIDIDGDNLSGDWKCKARVLEVCA